MLSSDVRIVAAKRPLSLGQQLRSLAEAGGTIQRSQNGTAGAKLEKRMEEIRSILPTRFRLETDPLPFIKGVGYQAQFRISYVRTPDGEAYGHVPVADHRETLMLRSKGFSRRFSRQFHQSVGKPPRAQALQEAVGLIEARAQLIT